MDETTWCEEEIMKTPYKIKQVAKAWLESAVKAGEAQIKEHGEVGKDAEDTRDFWKDRLYVSLDDRPDPQKGPRWIIGDNYERASNMVFSPEVDEWYLMPNYGSERPICGGTDEAMANAEIFWTG